MDKERPLSPSAAQFRAWLIARRNQKMAQSPHAYVRGNTAKFYAWLDEIRTQIPKGPPIWICGDCHMGNIGPIADAGGAVALQIRDLDQSAISNPAYDLIRLGLSLATAARGSALPGVITARILEALTTGYYHGLRVDDAVDTRQSAVIDNAVKNSLRRKWRDLAAERIGDTEPDIPRDETFLTLTPARQRAIETMIHTRRLRALVTVLGHRDPDASIRMLDCAYWVKGCSSLGLARYAVLVGVGDANPKTGGLCLLDLKRAVASVAPAAKGAVMPASAGRRVVMGARTLSPLLGTRMTSATLGSTSLFVRELLPQDLKLDIVTLTETEAEEVAMMFARVVGQAHARQLTRAQARAWVATMKQARDTHVAAPSWLWTSVVHLMARHEAAYLEHCRRYALLPKT